MKWLKDLFTEKDNATLDLKRVLAAFLGAAGVGMQGYAVHKGQAFDIKAFFEGGALFLGALGAAIGAVCAFKGENGQ